MSDYEAYVERTRIQELEEEQQRKREIEVSSHLPLSLAKQHATDLIIALFQKSQEYFAKAAGSDLSLKRF